MLEPLVDAIRSRQIILFAGAGTSMGLGLPSWHVLMQHIAQELGRSDLLERSEVSYLTLAEYYRLEMGSIGPLRSWMDRTWSVDEERLRNSKVHELIGKLDFPIIYTTNLDRNLELSFALRGREFVKITTARDLARVREGVTQIVKFHGDFDDDQSIVLTETDYFKRLAFDTPLDLKFQADALGRTVLFIGYSLSDLNIRLLLYRLWQTWHSSGFEKDRPASYVFMLEPNPVEEAVLKQWGLTAITQPDAPPEDALELFLQHLCGRARPATLG